MVEANALDANRAKKNTCKRCILRVFVVSSLYLSFTVLREKGERFLKEFLRSLVNNNEGDGSMGSKKFKTRTNPRCRTGIGRSTAFSAIAAARSCRN